MKKILTVILAVILTAGTFNSQAQSKNEFYVEYSQFTVLEGAYLTGGVMAAAFSLGHFDFGNTIMPGTFAVGYTRNVNSWFGYGGLVSAEYITSDTFTTDENGNRVKNGKFNLGLATLTPTAHFSWFRNPHFGMYSKLAAGIGLTFGSDIGIIPAFQVSPICMEFGGEEFKGVFELGIGTQGIATLGIKKIF